MINSKCKICRRLGQKLFLKGERCFSPKCPMVKRPYPPGQKRKRRPSPLSEYGKELREKQKLKHWYNLNEAQLRKYVKEVLNFRQKVEDPAHLLIKLLESRLDNVVFRFGFAVSRIQAKQLISHGHFLVNDKSVNIPSYQVKKDDIITLKPQKLKKNIFQNLSLRLKKQKIPSWLKLDIEKIEGKVIGEPSLEEAVPSAEISAIFEYYSRWLEADNTLISTLIKRWFGVKSAFSISVKSASIKMIPLPLKPKIIKKEKNKAVFEIEALYPGYGVTIGNSLRRILLSSLSGAAVTQMKIKGVQHEFSTIPGVLEDVILLMLNLKELRFKIFTDEPQKASLKVKGEKEVKGSDFQLPPQVELVNKNVHIATLTTKSAELEMEIQIEKGLGYQPREARKKPKEKSEIGVIYLDAIFTPIKRVAFKVENMRVGERTDFDRLFLEIETDGTISPEEAFSQASEILTNHFSLFAETFKTAEKIPFEKVELKRAKKNIKKKKYEKKKKGKKTK